MSHILNLNRGTFRLAQEVALGSRIKGPDAIAHACGGSVTRVRGSTLGLVGLGRIGGAVAVRAKTFGFDVVFYDPYVPDGVDKMLGIMRVDSLEAVMRQSRCISLHCNATKDNVRFINSEMLGEPVGTDERSVAHLLADCGISIDGQKLAVAPHRLRA